MSEEFTSRRNSVAGPFTRKRRLSHRDLLLEKSLQNVLNLASTERRRPQHRYYSTEDENTSRFYYDQYDIDEENELNNDDTDMSCHSCDTEEEEYMEERSRDRNGVFTNDVRFVEVDGFFMLESSSKKRSLWNKIISRTSLGQFRDQ